VCLCLSLLAVPEAEEVCLGRFWACLGPGRGQGLGLGLIRKMHLGSGKSHEVPEVFTPKFGEGSLVHCRR
jgi:hypothetical protein